MRVVLIAPAIPDYCVEYADTLAKKAQVSLICSARTFAEHIKYVGSSVDLHAVAWPRHRSPKNILFVLRLIRLVRSLRPDVVHFLSEGVLWLNLAVPGIRKYGLVTTVHDVSYHPGDHASRRIPRWFADSLILNSDGIVVHGVNLREGAERRYPSLKGKVEILSHLPLTRYRRIAESHNMRKAAGPTVNILFFGRIYAYKGLDVLIASVPMIVEHHRDIRVTIAGKGEDIDTYKQMMADETFFDVRNRYVPDEEAAQLFTDADIVVLPYIEASQSGVLAIANAFGKAVIVTDVGELGHSVEDGVSGLVIPPNDAPALASAVVKLAQDEALRTRLGLAGRRAAEASSSEAFAERAVEIYQRIGKSAAQRRGRRPVG
jgi:glycosyltransferase involved in cell wall biosynthesis